MAGDAFSGYVAQWRKINDEFLFASLPFKDKEKHVQQAKVLLEQLPAVEEFDKGYERTAYESLQAHKKCLLVDTDLAHTEPFAIYATVKTLLPKTQSEELSDIIMQEFQGVKASLLEVVGKARAEVPQSDDKAEYAKNLLQYSGKKIATSMTSFFGQSRDALLAASPQDRLLELPYADIGTVVGGSKVYVTRKTAQECKTLVDYLLKSELKEDIKKAVLKETISNALCTKEDVFSHFVSSVLVREPLLAKEVVPALRSLYEAR
jgi:hypothetical protein